MFRDESERGLMLKQIQRAFILNECGSIPLDHMSAMQVIDKIKSAGRPVEFRSSRFTAVDRT